jgi:coproporphyrinogen III oxidase
MNIKFNNNVSNTANAESLANALYFQNLQLNIVNALQELDGCSFIADHWKKEDTSNLQGYGCTQILENGNIFERAGVGFSCVHGNALPPSASLERQHLSNLPFDAMGVSIVVHPNNPYIPTVHFNIRSLVVHTKNNEQVWWFGGGMDLTPYYGFKEDCIHFHSTCKQALDPFSESFYPLFKQQCDDYFYLKHRQEARGIGGIFFDNFDVLGTEQSFSLVKSVANAFLLAYLPIVKKRYTHAFTQQHKSFQAFRRGRYVEFNLIYDRGTLFGLQSGGRTESILMSMPPNVNWRYNYCPEKNTEEHKLYTDFLPPQNWLNI